MLRRFEKPVKWSSEGLYTDTEKGSLELGLEINLSSPSRQGYTDVILDSYPKSALLDSR